MAMTEIKLISLAWSLAMNPTPADLSVFAGLTPPDQAIVRQLVEQKDQLPSELENIIEESRGMQEMAGPGAPTNESF